MLEPKHQNPSQQPTPARRETQIIELTEEIPIYSGVSFNAGNLTLNGQYPNELAAHRAKRVWVSTLENSFLLDKSTDFSVQVSSENDCESFNLVCEFSSACARYAFWRLTNNQAPEAQYLIETGHIPAGEAHYEDMLRAHDLVEEPMVLEGGVLPQSGIRHGATRGPLHDIVQKIMSRFRV